MNEKMLNDFLNSPEGAEMGKKIGYNLKESFKVFKEKLSKDLTAKEKTYLDFLISRFFDAGIQDLQEFMNKSKLNQKQLTENKNKSATRI